MPRRVKYPSRRRKYATRSRKFPRRRKSGIRRSLFRSRGRIRRNNTGRLNVNTVMRYGQSLPQTAFGPCKLVIASQQHYLAGQTMCSNLSAAGRHYNDGRRTLCLTTLTSPYAFYQDSSVLQHIRCFGLYRLLYKRYMILGAKVRIRLSQGTTSIRHKDTASGEYWASPNPPFGMPLLGNPSGGEDTTATWNQQVIAGSWTIPPEYSLSNPFFHTNPNLYWYVRVCAQEFDPATGLPTLNPDVDIGHQMISAGVNRLDTTGDMSSCPWSSLVDFLGDRTVSYSRDRKTWSSSNQSVVSGATNAFAMLMSGRRPSCTLKYNFSLRKLLKDKNLLRASSPFWRHIDEPRRSAPFVTPGYPLGPRQDVFLRFGCIWFDPDTGFPQYHYPLPLPFMAQTEVDYFCAWRDPTDINVLNNPEIINEALGAGAQELSQALAARQEALEKLTRAGLNDTSEETETILQALESEEGLNIEADEGESVYPMLEEGSQFESESEPEPEFSTA